MMRRFFKIAIAIGLAASVALAGALVVSAQGPKGLPWGGGGRRGSGMYAGLEEIAKALGMTADALTTQLKAGAKLADLAEKAGVDLAKLKGVADQARQTAARDPIEQAVKDGKLTRAQADWMLEGLTKGFTGRGGFGGHRGFGFGMPMAGAGQTGMDAAAKALGMTTEQLELQFWGGRTLAELAERAKVKVEDVQKAVEQSRQAAMRQAIEQAVKDGKLTPAQADWMLKGLDSGYMPGGGFFGGRGRLPKMGGRMFGRGMPFSGQRGTTPPTTTPGGLRTAPAPAGSSI